MIMNALELFSYLSELQSQGVDLSAIDIGGEYEDAANCSIEHISWDTSFSTFYPSRFILEGNTLLLSERY